MQRSLRWVGVLTLILGCLFGLLITPAIVSAADQCSEVIVDTTNDQVLMKERAELLAAVKRLENVGADVRIRAFQSAPDGGLDGYQFTQVKSCPDWQSPGGTTKHNLVVYLFSLDRKSAIFYGSNWNSSMGKNVDRIRADYMNAQFKLGNFSAGVTKSMAESYRVMNEQLHPSPAKVGSSRSIGDSEGGKIFVWLLVAIAGVIAAVVAGFGVRHQLNVRRQRREELLEAEQKAKQVYREANAAIVDLDTSMAQRTVALTTTNLNEEDATAVLNAWNVVKSAEAQAVILSDTLNMDSFANDPTHPQTLKGYLRIIASYTELLSKVNATNEAVAAVEKQCNELREEMEKAPETLELIKGQLAETRHLARSLRDEGYKIAADEQLFATVNTHLAAAEGHLATSHYGFAIGELEQADELSQEVLAQLRSTKSRHEVLEQRLNWLTDDLRTRSAIQSIMDTVGRRYSRSCWDDLVLPDGVSPEVAQDHLAAAKSCLSMKKQEWDQSEQSLDKAQSIVDALNKFFNDVETRLAELDQIAGSCMDTVASLKHRVEEVSADVDGFRGSQGSNQEALRGIRERIQRLQAAAWPTWRPVH